MEPWKARRSPRAVVEVATFVWSHSDTKEPRVNHIHNHMHDANGTSAGCPVGKGDPGDVAFALVDADRDMGRSRLREAVIECD
jgi:hypothetical protein